MIILVLLIVLILLIFRYPYLALMIGICFIGYPYLITRYNSSANFISSIITTIKKWIQTGTIQYPAGLEIAKSLSDDAFQADIYDKTTELTDYLDEDIKNDNIKKIYSLFPEIELYQNWLFEQQSQYVDYQYDVYQIWKKMLDKLIDIISNPTSYAASNMTDFINLEYQMVELFEFINNNISTSTSPKSVINQIVLGITERHRTINEQLVKWILVNSGDITTRGCPQLRDFMPEDWVAPSNLMKFN